MTSFVDNILDMPTPSGLSDDYRRGYQDAKRAAAELALQIDSRLAAAVRGVYPGAATADLIHQVEMTIGLQTIVNDILLDVISKVRDRFDLPPDEVRAIHVGEMSVMLDAIRDREQQSGNET